jgi:hypothetical protein
MSAAAVAAFVCLVTGASTLMLALRKKRNRNAS